VRKGQKLAQLYAPDILSAPGEFSAGPEAPLPGCRRGQGGQGAQLVAAVGCAGLDHPRDRTHPRDQEPGSDAGPDPGHRDPDDGPRQHVCDQGREMFTIADLSRVWVLVEVFEHQIAWLRPGLKAEIEVPAYPGKQWQGVVDYLYPDLDPKTRGLARASGLSQSGPPAEAEYVRRGGNPGRPQEACTQAAERSAHRHRRARERDLGSRSRPLPASGCGDRCASGQGGGDPLGPAPGRHGKRDLYMTSHCISRSVCAFLERYRINRMFRINKISSLLVMWFPGREESDC